MGGRGSSFSEIGKASQNNSSTQNNKNVLQTVYPNATKNVVAFEKGVRNNNIETLTIFDKNGNILLQNSGTANRAQANVTTNIADGIFTHNHPTQPGDGRYGKIGLSFSGDDIYNAIKFNQAEVRVVTETYTFSMKRPSGGWGVSEKAFTREYKQERRRVTNDLNTTKDRAIITREHIIMRNLAKKYGWQYSKKQNK